MSDATHGGNPYKAYWISWAILLTITVIMLVAEALHMPRIVLVLLLLGFMMVKAVMIGANFMHLRYENRSLAVMVAAGILVTSLILYVFVSQESAHVLSHTVR
jgi:caa(3)-type oxidase subunit IV